MDKALLDTDIFSEILKRKNRSVSGRARAYRGHYGRFTLSSATVMEVVSGLCRLGAQRQMENLLQALEETEILPVDRSTAILAGRDRDARRGRFTTYHCPLAEKADGTVRVVDAVEIL